MKKLILSTLFIAAIATTSFAQLSLKAGVNFANQSYDVSGFTFDPGTKVGFLIGANFAFNFSPSMALRPGLQFSTKGSKLDFNGSDISSNFSYVEVPIDVVFNSGILSFHGGPYLGMLMSATSDNEDIKDFVKSADFGVNFGLAATLGNFGVGANYGLGLGNINDDGTDDSVKNKVLNLYVTFTL